MVAILIFLYEIITVRMMYTFVWHYLWKEVLRECVDRRRPVRLEHSVGLTLNLECTWLKVLQSGKKCKVNTEFWLGNFLDGNCMEKLTRGWEFRPFSIVVTVCIVCFVTFDVCTFWSAQRFHTFLTVLAENGDYFCLKYWLMCCNGDGHFKWLIVKYMMEHSGDCGLYDRDVVGAVDCMTGT
jgi:hypothetical protein